MKPETVQQNQPADDGSSMKVLMILLGVIGLGLLMVIIRLLGIV